MKRSLLGLFGALLVLLLIGYFFRTDIALRMMERVVATNLGDRADRGVGPRQLSE